MAPSKSKTATASKPAKASTARRFGLSDDEDEEMQVQRAPAHDESEQDEVADKATDARDVITDARLADESMDTQIEETAPEVREKDAEEEELERMIFGDAAGFKDGLDTFSLETTGYGAGQDGGELGGEDDEDLDNVADQQLFFFDSGPVGLPKATAAGPSDNDEEDDDEKAAWEDSDDERLVISLASIPRLKKLRETEEDDVVNGKDYARRLTRQYNRLYPTPDWALQAMNKTKRKRDAGGEHGSDDDSASDMDVDDEDNLSAQPLARLLKDADILSRTTRGPAKRRKLQAGVVDIQKLRSVADPGPSAITSLSFHPTYPLLLSSGPSSTLYLHHVNPNAQSPNPLLTSMHIKRTPLTTTAFHPSPSDSRIFLSARRRYFHVWDLASGTVEKVSRVYGHQHEQRSMERFSLSPNGRWMALLGSTTKGGGLINILDARTLQWAKQVRIQSGGGIADYAWWGSGAGLAIAGKNGEVTEWDVENGVVGRWQDEGAVGTTVISLGGKSGREDWLGGDRWAAVGSSSGIVNIYDRRAWCEQNATDNGAKGSNGGLPKAPKPLRVLENLTTPTSFLEFSPDGQILCMASRWKRNALRLVHLPSATVFKNWPTQKTTLDRISAVAWGRPTEEDEKEGSLALLAVASEAGRIRLWEVRN